MAHLEDLIAQVSNPSLRRQLEDALAELKQRRKFGIVFEKHSERSALAGVPIRPGQIVQRSDDLKAQIDYRVLSVSSDGSTTITPVDNDSDVTTVATTTLLAIKDFGEPIYPTLTPIGSRQLGDDDRPYHAIINGENFHALELFLYLFEGCVDCIYIDPPYNSGARDWKYNNRYVDEKDAWRHSKWLSFVERRLKLARRLLKPDGVLIVTINEYEIFHLGMLLERLFPYPRYSLYEETIVSNPKGTGARNFARADEAAIFVVPQIGRSIILEQPIKSASQSTFESDKTEDQEGSDTLSNEKADVVLKAGSSNCSGPEWEVRHARRRGGGGSSYRPQRPHEFYPIFIDEEAKKVVRAGDWIPLDVDPDFSYVDGLRPIWPIDEKGQHRCWRFIPETMRTLINAGNVIVRYNKNKGAWILGICEPKKTTKAPKTVMWGAAYDSGSSGSSLLNEFLGEPSLFPFPKSVYAVQDCLAIATHNRPSALILDFFAGSGTTFHATCLLNAADGGKRRSILVTNNEVQEKVANKLNKEGYFRGDPSFESQGIFERVTRPRCEAVITGRRPDGKPVPGNHTHASKRPYSQGFAENIEFYRLDYLDPNDVDLGRQFDAILPVLWMAAGSIGTREDGAEENTSGFSMPPDSTYAVLFRESRFRYFQKALAERPDITHVWLVTDSEEAYSEMRSALPRDLYVSMLYRDYLRNFRINIEKSP
jgi:adenine-specific DNA-methyltransferase